MSVRSLAWVDSMSKYQLRLGVGIYIPLACLYIRTVGFRPKHVSSGPTYNVGWSFLVRPSTRAFTRNELLLSGTWDNCSGSRAAPGTRQPQSSNSAQQWQSVVRYSWYDFPFNHFIEHRWIPGYLTARCNKGGGNIPPSQSRPSLHEPDFSSPTANGRKIQPWLVKHHIPFSRSTSHLTYYLWCCSLTGSSVETHLLSLWRQIRQIRQSWWLNLLQTYRYQHPWIRCEEKGSQCYSWNIDTHWWRSWTMHSDLA